MQQRLGDGRVDLVLYCDVWAVALAVLRGEAVGPFARQGGTQPQQRVSLQRQGDAATERLQAGDANREGAGLSGDTSEVGGDVFELGAGKMVKNRNMSGEEVALGREVGGAQPVQACLIFGGEGEAEDQGRRVARWLALTRVMLPGVAVEHRWPIRLDHCFMRVLLDNAVGGVWHHTIARPAIKHADAETLERAIGLGERVMREPSELAVLNRRSLDWRRLAREGANRV